MRLINLSNLQQFTAVNLSSDPGEIGGPVQIPQCAEINLVWNTPASRQAHNVLHATYSGGFAGTVAQANAILAALTTGAQWTALALFLSPNSALSFVTIRDLNAINQPLISSSGGGAVGTSTGTAMPGEVAAAVTLRTAKTGRANRGRFFVPNWASNATATGDVIAAGAVTALQNWANTISAALSAQGYTWCIGQKARQAYVGITGTQHPARPAGTVAITSASVRDNHWDSQRRRGLR